MESINRTPTVSAPRYVWGLLWGSMFLQTACFWLIPFAAVQHRSRHSPHSLPPHAPDLSVPLLLCAVFASLLTWQAWQSQKSEPGRFKPKTNPAEAKRAGRIVFAIVGGMFALLECLWVFGSPGARVNWPLLAVLNVGTIAGWLGFWRVNRLLPAPPGPDVDPLAPVPQAAPPKPEPLPAPPSYSATRQETLPESLIGFVAFLCLLAIVVLAFTPGMASFMSLPLTARDAPLLLFFSSMGAIIALATAAGLMRNRRDAGVRLALAQDQDALQKTAKETAKEAFSAFVGFAAIGLICAIGTMGLHQNWPLLIGCGAGMYAMSLLLKWAVTQPLPLSASAEAAQHIDWLPKRGVARITSREVVLTAPWPLRAFVGGFGLVMAGMMVTCLLMVVNPGLFGRYPHGMFWRVVPLFLFFAMALFTTLIIGGAGPRELRLELDARRYTQTGWKPLSGSMGKDGFFVPFCMVRTSGTMDADMSSLCLREFRNQGNTRYILQIAWRDAAKPPYILKGFSTPEEARIALAQAADALGLPALGRCE